MRIVSLLPAATDLVAELGLVAQLVGRTHECDWPPGALDDIPVVTRSTLDLEPMSSREISDAVGGAAHRGSALYHLDDALLGELRPDVVLTQDLCDVCATSYRDVSHAVGVLGGDGPGPLVINLRPATLPDVLDQLVRLGDVLGVPEAGLERAAELQERLDAVQKHVAGLTPPRVAAIEWLDPPWPAGHWAPEQITIAGGEPLLADPGQHTTSTSWATVAAARPEVLLLMPCGFAPARTIAELGADRPWAEVRGVEAVWVLDGPAHFNRPGPRVVRGVEILAEVLHGPGTTTAPLEPGDAERIA